MIAGSQRDKVLPSWSLDSKELNGNQGELGNKKELLQSSIKVQSVLQKLKTRDHGRWPAEERAV